MPPLLRVLNAQKSYKGRPVLRDFSMHVAEGEFVGLFGPNGSGKTTTFKIINGMVNPGSGKVFLGERDISHTPTYQRAGLGIGYLSQDPSFFRLLSVYDNLKAVLQLLRVARRDVDDRIQRLLMEVGLHRLQRQKAYKLSGGEKRRLEMAIVLCLSPKVVLLDEPFLGVDPIGIEHLKELILTLRGNGIAAVVTDHNIRDAVTLVDRAYILHEGNIIFEGPSEDIKNDSVVRERYLGRLFSF